jgi:hypothetical protein
MTDNFGSGVSRVLDPVSTEYLGLVFQQGRPPLDASINLISQLSVEWDRTINLVNMPSGWIGGENGLSQDFVTDPTWSNWFKFGAQRSGEAKTFAWANVNGWLIPVTGTRTGAPPGSPDNSSTWNLIALPPAPANSGDHRTDFVFLEVWKARVAPNPASANKPAANAVWKYGNVEGGMSFIPDDIKDPAIGFETTQRIQLQYRIRVVSGVLGLTQSPDGFDPTTVKAKGAYDPTNPDTATSFIFTNMRTTLGDPGLWRAGDGTQNALGTVDGYVYAIPIALVFRRNSVAWNGHPSQNLNGAINRNPTAVDRTGIKTFTATATLAADITTTSVLTATLVTSTGIPLPLNPATALTVKIDNEVMTYSIISGTTITFLTRGAKGTRAEVHKAGATVTLYQERPDGLWADQVAETDLLDLRHVVTPNGFDYRTVLLNNLDKLLRGNLRSTWKYTGTGPQGTFLPYQDVISNVAASIGTTKLDGPDGFRQVWSDTACVQHVDVYVDPTSVQVVPFGGAATPNPIVFTPPGQPINSTWDLPASVYLTSVANTYPTNANHPASQLLPGDTITIPIAQFKSGVPSSDQDQVRFVYDADTDAVKIYIEGLGFIHPSYYTVTGGDSTTPAADLSITLGANFPVTTSAVRITVTVQYGAGRGLSRKPSALHSVAYYGSIQNNMMLQTEAIPDNNVPLRTSYLPLWAKENGSLYRSHLPVIAEAYGDLGSKTVVLTPFRKVGLPSSSMWSFDATNVNIGTTATIRRQGTTGQTGASWAAILTDNGQDFITGTSVAAGDRVVFTGGPGPWPGSPQWPGESFVVQSVTDLHNLVLDRPLPPNLTGGTYNIYTGSALEGPMPLKKLDGATTKWTTSDPLGAFSTSADSSVSRKSICTILPRELIPGMGEVYVPIQWQSTSGFSEGINYTIESRAGITVPTLTNPGYVPYNFLGTTDSFAVFSTLNLNLPVGPAVYNQAFTWSGHKIAGIRKFNDVPDITRPTARGLSRKGLELPPYYGIARLFSVYEANDYALHQSAYNQTDRTPLAPGTGATNLLRQNFDGPTFWVEVDDDGDSTFILNANAIDISRSPNAIVSFDSGDFVIEASIFGVDRGSFLPGHDFRLVLTRDRSDGLHASLSQAGDPTTRANNIHAALPTPPALIIPAPPNATDTILVNYSRVPYQGDCWQSQQNGVDSGYYQGPLTAALAYQISSTKLDESNLLRPNQKPLEVLASVGFLTTLGTGRFSGPANVKNESFWAPGIEWSSAYPPPTQVSPRPYYFTAALSSSQVAPISTEYLGCIAQLPLGSLLRDKDFIGGFIDNATGGTGALRSPLVITSEVQTPSIWAGGLAKTTSRETREILLDNSSMASGQPGDIVVQVDGNPNQGSYTQLTNFRTYRGGSAFAASGSHPGGELYSVQGTALQEKQNVLACRAYLVRNAPTNVGASEVSAGNELMMLIVTSATRFYASHAADLPVVIGTNGTGEGWSASDLYRIDGHPLTATRTPIVVDPTTISLSKSFTPIQGA